MPPLSLQRAALVLAAALIAGTPRSQERCGLEPCHTLPFTVSDSSSFIRSADSFQLAADAEIHRIRWWGTYVDEPGTSPCGAMSDDFTIRIWADGGEGPDGRALIADLSAFQVPFSGVLVGQVNAGGAAIGVFEYEIDLGVAPLAVPAGARWWFEVHNDLSSSFGCYWNWVVGGCGGDGFYSYTRRWPRQAPWSPSSKPVFTPGYDLAFALYDAEGSEVHCSAAASRGSCDH